MSSGPTTAAKSGQALKFFAALYDVEREVADADNARQA